MAILINGDGNSAVYANQDSDFYAAIMGGTTGITPIGKQFNYNLEDANTISVEDGVIITKEGRRIQLDKDKMDLFTIPVGSQGQTTYYIIGYELKNTESGTQICDTFLEQMDDGTATIEEEEFRDGADSVKVSLYRVKQEGLTITTVTKLLGNLTTVGDLQTQVATINEDLTDNGETFKFGYDSQTDQMGYYKKVSGADTFFPFKKGFEYMWIETAYDSAPAISVLEIKSDDAENYSLTRNAYPNINNEYLQINFFAYSLNVACSGTIKKPCTYRLSTSDTWHTATAGQTIPQGMIYDRVGMTFIFE